MQKLTTAIIFKDPILRKGVMYLMAERFSNDIGIFILGALFVDLVYSPNYVLWYFYSVPFAPLIAFVTVLLCFIMITMLPDFYRNKYALWELETQEYVSENFVVVS